MLAQKGQKEGVAWMAQSVKYPTLDFGSGHDLTKGLRSSPALGSVLTAWSLLEVLSLPPSLPLPCMCTSVCSLARSQNKHLKKREHSKLMPQKFVTGEIMTINETKKNLLYNKRIQFHIAINE